MTSTDDLPTSELAVDDLTGPRLPAAVPEGVPVDGTNRHNRHLILTEIDHIAIAVRDLEVAIAYYAEAFGAEVHHREIVESDGVEEALLKVADSNIQLTAATRPDSPIAKSTEKRGEGPHHVGYRFDDCAAALRCS